MIRASISKAPSTAPMTIPAICPPVRPRCAPAAPAPAPVGDPVPDIVWVAVIVIGFNADVAMIGSSTLLQRDVVSENTQHESVEFGELDAQYEQSPPRFDVKPQLSGWFSTASIQDPMSEVAGSAQLVKSARICETAPVPAVPQMLLAVISCSLSAYDAHDSAQSGRVASPDRLHGVIEFCIIALQSTLVVYRA